MDNEKKAILKQTNFTKISRYKHDFNVSYALGATLTLEALENCPNLITRVFISSKIEKSQAIDDLISLCKKNNIKIENNDKAFNILSPKGNCYVIGEFLKFKGELNKDVSHIVLVNPSDAGNLGTILRTCVGFEIKNIAIVKPAVDCFDPKVIRASMGAIFHSQIEYFENIDEYIKKFPNHKRYAFMLSSSTSINGISFEKPCSLVFGNEASGLSDNFKDFCIPVRINHSQNIDSLSLPMAVGIGVFEFTKDNWK